MIMDVATHLTLALLALQQAGVCPFQQSSRNKAG